MKEQTIQDFPLISSRQTEMAIIAGAISACELLPTARCCISEAHFNEDDTRSLWRLLCDMEDKRQPINASTVASKGVNVNLLGEILCSPDYPTYEDSMESYCANLRTATAKRKCYFDALELLRASSSAESDEAVLYAFAERIADDINEGNMDEDLISIDEAIEKFRGEIKAKKEGKVISVRSGFSKLDNETNGGFESDELIILAARPSVGKTAVALQMIRAAAEKSNPVAVFSLEMSNSALVRRMMTATGKALSYQLAAGVIDNVDFNNAARDLKGKPIHFCDTAFSLDSLVSKITRAYQRGKCKIAFIDYLGLINNASKGSNLYQQVTDTTRRLKLLAKKLHIPIVLLCQLNRSSSSDGRSPQLYDLRDSGSIEQDADIVLMLENPSKETMEALYPDLLAQYSENLNKLVLMWIRKNRRGQRDGAILLEATNSYTFFKEVGGEETEIPEEPTEAENDLPF